MKKEKSSKKGKFTISIWKIIKNYLRTFATDMLSSIKKFFVFSLLLLCFYNISGLSTCIEHAQHSNRHSAEKESNKKENHASVSQDDNCQCALHFQMNHVLLPEIAELVLPFPKVPATENVQHKATTYRCLIDFFSSRAPPFFS